MNSSVNTNPITRFKLTLSLEEQTEGGFTITCQEIPELITECDSLDDIQAVVTDALYAVIELYECEKRPFPEDVQILEDNTDATDTHLLETVVPIHEVSRSHQKVETTWL